VSGFANPRTHAFTHSDTRAAGGRGRGQGAGGRGLGSLSVKHPGKPRLFRGFRRRGLSAGRRAGGGEGGSATSRVSILFGRTPAAALPKCIGLRGP
jgi:hypothetical protein